MSRALDFGRRRCLQKGVMFVLAPLFVPAGVQAESLTVLRFGVHPFRAPEPLFSLHRGMVAFLGESLGMPVRFYTRAGFDEFALALRDEAFEIAITAPHVAAWLAADHGWEAVATYDIRLAPVLATLTRPLPTPLSAEALRGRRIAVADLNTIISQVGLNALRQLGSAPTRDIELVVTPTHGAALQALLNGSVDYALVANTVFGQFQKEHPALRAVPFGPSVPHLVVMARSNLPEALRERFRQSLLRFHDSPAGASYFTETGYVRFVPVRAEDMALMAGFVDTLRLRYDRGGP
ncbi:MAG: PhnD/SsuA/transferrin family substrate-binding protein [Halothiobacillaceae bacterium]|jgi:phosphonate transport system substrate-binding protein|nr:PhnD/SsuA/transferrin family substrate-binding protein [Halothiobacillaceae bacterium]MDY0049855.1 PhnD/SsuA/transferrin family substrate-binding protein [Halothiobacillaceae bacterium]